MNRISPRKALVAAAVTTLLGTPAIAVPLALNADAATSSTTYSNLSSEQKANARAIIEVAKKHNLNRHAMEIAIATAMQESTLRNLDYGDRDSVGLFQQRPSMGWGTVAQCRNPELAAAAFFGVAQHTSNPGLVDIKGWENMSLTQAAQAVQRSGFPDAYAKWEALAKEIVSKELGATASSQPTAHSTTKPTVQPTHSTTKPTVQPTSKPTVQPTHSTTKPTVQPTSKPTVQPSSKPTVQPSSNPTVQPSSKPTVQPSGQATPKATPHTAPPVPETQRPSTAPVPPVTDTQPPATDTAPSTNPVPPASDTQPPATDPGSDAGTTASTPAGEGASTDAASTDAASTDAPSGTTDAGPVADEKGTPAPQDTTGGLADTGAPVSPFLVAASLSAVVAGTVLLARRRRS